MNHTAPGALAAASSQRARCAAAAALAFTGCAGNAAPRRPDGTTGGRRHVGVSLIVKTTTNPFFVAMQDGAEAAAERAGVELTLAAGKEDGDEDTQIQAIENAISKGDAGILITPNGPAVEDALVKARDAGLLRDRARHAALRPATPWTSPSRPTTSSRARRSASGRPPSSPARRPTIAHDRPLRRQGRLVDVARDQGFLDGMGIDLADDPRQRRRGGDRHLQRRRATRSSATRRRRAPRTAAAPPPETLLAKNPDINVVYTINEPAAYGAYRGVRGRGQPPTDLIVVSVDGGCAGVDAVDGRHHRRHQPAVPGEDGRARRRGDRRARRRPARGPENTEGLDFFNTGVALVTDEPARRRRLDRHRRGRRASAGADAAAPAPSGRGPGDGCRGHAGPSVDPTGPRRPSTNIGDHT